MKRILAAATVALMLAGSGAVYAQSRDGGHRAMRANPEDRLAFADAKIAAVKAGLKLTADQEKLWQPVEAAVRDFAKMRIERAEARREARKSDAKTDEKDKARADVQADDNPVARMQRRADAMAVNAAALKRIADAADPLYKTLDEGQKRRLTVLTRGAGRFVGERWHRGWDRDGKGMSREEGRKHHRGDSDRDSRGDRDSGGEKL